MNKQVLTLAEVAPRMQPGDLILWESTSSKWDILGRAFSRLIRASGRTRYCHVDMLARKDDKPGGAWTLLGMLEEGGRGTPLMDEVAAYPGRLAWYRTNPDGRWREGVGEEFCRDRAVRCMRQLLPGRYGWRAIGRMARFHLAFVRLFFQPDFNDESPRRGRPVCSTAVAEAIHYGGVDPVLELADADTEPGDLARTHFFRYQGHLSP